MTLACGHEPSPRGAHTTGTAHTGDGREICWDCANREEVDALKTAQRFLAYLTEATEATGAVLAGLKAPVTLTTWAGGLLARVTYLTKARHNIGGTLYYFRATDVHGGRWYGTSPGPNMYARMRRSREA